MADYALCEVLNVTTSGIELLLERPLEPGTVVTILVRPEGSQGRYYRVIGSVERRESRESRWLHVIRASSRRPWSSMFIYDVMYQALTGSKAPANRDGMYVDNANGGNQSPENQYLALIEDLEKTALWLDATTEDHRDDRKEGSEPAVHRTLAWFAPFDELNNLLRQVIAREHHLAEVPAGTVLVERGSLKDVSIYLVEGVVEVESFDGKRFGITAGTDDAHFPISVLRPHAYTVRAVTDVTAILLSQEVVRKAARVTAAYKSQLGIEVTESEGLPAEFSDF